MFKIAAGLVCLALIGYAGKYSWDQFSAYQEDKSDERISASHDDEYATQHRPSSCGAVMLEASLLDGLACLADNITARGGGKQADYDLKAQQDMAVWAFGMLIITVWLAVITFFGVFFVWRTLKSTQDMARVTRDIGNQQTKAAIQTVEQGRKANDITREAMQSANRPFIVVIQKFSNENEWRHGKESGSWEVELRNYGNGPAILLDAHWQTWVGPNEETPENRKNKLLSKGFAGSVDDDIIHLGKSISKTVSIQRLGEGQFPQGGSGNQITMALQDGKIFGWLDVSVVYESLYGTKHETRALFRIENFLGTSTHFGGNQRNYRT
ncbi:hypothetical protein [Puniceibacterium sp. IMCC21224]|uniref:hypothetical protein n=1 Tax=Puniceibacterium sp. IMCC21224 TaxID=1618204 RepID=UPI0012E02F27|nr:hypothetical protein [Puniceibacterium sp. IMCC21224]